jgi:hypothetical protein
VHYGAVGRKKQWGFRWRSESRGTGNAVSGKGVLRGSDTQIRDFRFSEVSRPGLTLLTGMLFALAGSYTAENNAKLKIERPIFPEFVMSKLCSCG